MMAAPRAILLQLDAIRGVPPVLPAVVVPALALLASQRYQLSHNLPPNHRDGLLAIPVHQRCVTPLSLLRRLLLQSCLPRGWQSSTPHPSQLERSTPRSLPCCPPASPSPPLLPGGSPPSHPSF